MSHDPKKVPVVLSNDDAYIMICAPRKMTKKDVKKWAVKNLNRDMKDWFIEECLNLYGPNGHCSRSQKHVHYFLQPTTVNMKMPENKNYDSDGRELIGTVILSSGEELKIYMPIFGDYFKIPVNSFDNIVPHLCAAATRMTVDELSKIPYPDGLIILEKLAPALQAMGDYLKNNGDKKKGK